jgi:hypothetical protein
MISRKQAGANTLAEQVGHKRKELSEEEDSFI